MKHKPSKKTLSGWIVNHMSPHFGWQDYPVNYDIHKESSDDVITGLEDKIKDHVILGVKFKWRF